MVRSEQAGGRVMVLPEQPADIPAIHAVHVAAFEQTGEADLVDALRAGPWWHPELSLVAERDGEIVGHVLVTDVELAGRPVFALGPIGVLPVHQRDGVGIALMGAALDAAARSDRGLITLLGDPAYYARFGFTPAAEDGVLDPWGAPAGYFQVLRLPAYTAELVGTPEYPAPWLAV